MRFIGADLHKKSITFCVVETDSGKTVVRQRMRVNCCEVERIAEFLASHAPYQLAVEALDFKPSIDGPRSEATMFRQPQFH